MSQIKRYMERLEAQRLTAIEIAVDAGILTRCEYHDEVFDDDQSGDNTAAYKLGNYRLSQGELGGVFSSPREMTDAVKAAIEDAAIECGWCAKD